jgi:hypothetical protein
VLVQATGLLGNHLLRGSLICYTELLKGCSLRAQVSLIEQSGAKAQLSEYQTKVVMLANETHA